LSRTFRLTFLGAVLSVKRRIASKSYHNKPKNTFFFHFIMQLGKVFDKEPQKRQ